jgi:hypothetical protein
MVLEETHSPNECGDNFLPLLSSLIISAFPAGPEKRRVPSSAPCFPLNVLEAVLKLSHYPPHHDVPHTQLRISGKSSPCSFM